MKEVIILGVILVVLLILLWVFRIKNERGFTMFNDAWDPPVVINNILTPDECQYIIEQATPKFSRSAVVGVDGLDPSRTSESAWIPKTDPIAQKILAKATELTEKPLENCEDIQVVRYEPGTFYRPHHDSCCDSSEGCINFEKDGGQRVGTLLLYLNSDFTDGETHFPDYNGGFKIKVPPGSAIFFRPLGADEAKCHPKALHEGIAPSSGVKYVCNVWVRENKFRT